MEVLWFVLTLHWWFPGVIGGEGATRRWDRMGTAGAGPIIGLLLTHTSVAFARCVQDWFYSETEMGKTFQ